MTNMTLVWGIVALIVFIAGAYWYTYKKDEKEAKEFSDQNQATKQMRLAAYERLVLLTNRIGLNEVVSRSGVGELPLRQAQSLLSGAIREEYDYNLTQQIYVSEPIWQAVTNLKDQNIYIINQLATMLPANANGMDLSKKIMEFLMQDDSANLQPVVLKAINFEAKQLLETA
jgi:glucose uptake protein GlcU